MSKIEQPVYSRNELVFTDSVRPHVATGHVINEEHFPFVIELMGVAEPMANYGQYDDSSNMRVASVALRTEEVEALSTHGYETAAEAVAVGDAFPFHDIYETLQRNWEIEQESYGAKRPNGSTIGRYALIAVYLSGPMNRIQDLRDCPTYQDERLDLAGNDEFRYVFARGNKTTPLLETRFERQIQPSDLSAPDYEAFRRVVIGNPEAVKVNFSLGIITALQIARDMPPNASEDDLHWATHIAVRIATEESSCLPEDEGREAYFQQVYDTIMTEIFGDSYQAAKPHLES